MVSVVGLLPGFDCEAKKISRRRNMKVVGFTILVSDEL